MDLHELVDSVSYVPLETSDRILLGDVLCAKRAGDYYFVQDTKGLFAFDAHGRFVSEIGHRGQGPGEYYNLDCFYLDSGRLACIVSNVQKKIFRYTFDGKFHSTLSLEDDDANIVFVMTCDEGEHLLAHYPLPNDAKATDREYAMLSCQGDKLTAAKLLDAPKVHSGVTIHPLLYEPMASFRNRPLFISAFRRADELAMAMESRCYNGGANRTRMNVMKVTSIDYTAIILFVVYWVVIIAMRIIL